MAQQHQLTREVMELLETWDAAWKEKGLLEVTENSLWPFANADKSVSLSLLNSECPPALPWQFYDDIAPVYFTQLWSTPVSCITSSVLIKMYTCQGNSKKI